MMQDIKICGVKSLAFAKEAAKCAKYLGFIFVPSSPRAVTPTEAAKIRSALPECVKTVGVFTLESIIGILAIMEEASLDIVQLHRPATSEEVKILKEAGYGVWVLDSPPLPNGADGILVDARDGSKTGGTGKRADWERAAALARMGEFTILAGGLSKDNIAAARLTGAAVLDVNSSLETSPGEKSVDKLKEFMQYL